MKKSDAPDWFYIDKKNGVSAGEIEFKLREEIMGEVEKSHFDRRIWTEEFVTKIANLHYRFLNQLYLQSS